MLVSHLSPIYHMANKADWKKLCVSGNPTDPTKRGPTLNIFLIFFLLAPCQWGSYPVSNTHKQMINYSMIIGKTSHPITCIIGKTSQPITCICPTDFREGRKQTGRNFQIIIWLLVLTFWLFEKLSFIF